jgi:hypothetical protein
MLAIQLEVKSSDNSTKTTWQEGGGYYYNPKQTPVLAPAQYVLSDPQHMPFQFKMILLP